MTQSGQGEEPSARQAHEGIVLPSDGGEPVLPGMTGRPASTAPAGGQAWGDPWGPGRQEPQRQDQGWPPAAAPGWGGPEQQGGPGPLPPEDAPTQAYGAQAGHGAHGSYGDQGYGAGGAQPQHQQPQYPQQYGDYGTQGAHGGHGASPLPAENASGGYGDPYAPQYGGGRPPAAPLPPAVPDAYRPGLPYGADEGATQYIPPVPQGRADEGATQFLPPVSGGALPPEAAGHHGGRPGGDADATQYIPPYGAQQGRHGQPGQQGGGERQPPAEFDNLFRGDPAGGVAGSTQQMPRVQDAHPYPGSGPAPLRQRRDDGSMDDDGYGGGGGGRGGGGGGRGRSRVPLIAAIGVGIVVVGVGAGALLSGGDGDGGSGDGKTAAATAPADPSGSPSASSDAADPAKEQAVALDKLLGDSGGSRATVVRSVENIKRCDSLPQAASDLRGAAKQRAGLVTSLGKLSVDKLPNNAALTAALTAAWKASAAADSHYAAWADQTAGKKGCKDGHARTTPQVQAGNRESGTASAQKAKAAALWNAIAGKYGLTQRQPIQL